MGLFFPLFLVSVGAISGIKQFKNFRLLENILTKNFSFLWPRSFLEKK